LSANPQARRTSNTREEVLEQFLVRIRDDPAIPQQIREMFEVASWPDSTVLKEALLRIAREAEGRAR